MPDFVPAQVVSQPEWGWQSLLGHPGAMWPVANRINETSDYQVAVCEQWQVCCPGCGKVVYEFLSGRGAILGGVPDRRIVFDRDNQSLSLDKPVTFVPCGCGTWDLHRSVWRFIAPLATVPRD
jgi:hypothetical protein